MEKNQDKQQIRRYLNGAYNSHEAKEMAESLLRADKEGILDDLADEVWEEALSLPEPSDQIKEQYKKEAQHLLESMQSQNAHSPSGYSIWLRVSLHLFLRFGEPLL